jgi:serine/threonine protein kinase
VLYENNIVHRDIKLENLLINNGVYKIGDFGLSKIIESQDEIVSSKGTPIYAAPELSCKQLVANENISKIDIYSFGCVLC